MAKEEVPPDVREIKREQAVRERRASTQELERAARSARLWMIPPANPLTRSEPIVKRDERKVARIHGTLAISAEPDGYGFIEPAAGGGQLLVRQGSIEAVGLRVGDVVQYAVSPGSFAIEAVSVRPGRDSARRR